MSTTSIRLPSELKDRVARAAQSEGTTAHAFILQAIEDKAELVERQAQFHALGERRMDAIRSTGKTVRWDEARQYLLERAAGRRAAKPRARKL